MCADGGGGEAVRRDANDVVFLYSLVGRDGSIGFVFGAVRRYHLIAAQWQELDDLNIARHSASCTFVRCTSSAVNQATGSTLASIELYTGDWEVLSATLHIGRSEHISVTHPNGWIVTVGDTDRNGDAAMPELLEPVSHSMATTQLRFARTHFLHAVYRYDLDLAGAGRHL